MKTIIKSILLLAAVIILTSSAWVTLTLMRPALITVPLNVKSLVVIDRTLPMDQKKNKVEEVLTGELFRQDEQAVQQAMNGVIETVQGAPRFIIKRSTERLIGETSGTIFPPALSWAEIKKLCEKYDADALIAIETFDSDYIITSGTRATTRTNSSGTTVPSIEFYAQGLATVNIGFRFYDPIAMTIADQYQFAKQMHFESGGMTIADAAQALLDKMNAINRTSYTSGEIYAGRITPTYYTATRYFFNRPKKNKKLMEGVRKSEVADWTGAIESWEEAIKTAKKDKHRGRAMLNIAVGYEVLGDLDKALEWASKAYTQYGNKEANDYVDVLRKRMREEAVTKEQMGK